MAKLTAEDDRSPAQIAHALLTMVRENLANDRISSDENFLSAEGNPAFGAKVQEQVRRKFGVDLPESEILAAPTVQQLAAVVERTLDEKRLAGLWTEVLGVQEIGVDDDFFDLGGDSVLGADLLQRISQEFGQNILLAEIFDSPTIRKQALLIRRSGGNAELPPGVLALQPKGTRNNFYWVHYLTTDLAKVIGDDQPLLYVALTANDFPALGPTPTLQAIAACLTRKIMAAQPHGPYSIGGLCLGGILAYEMASQLTATGQQVSLLVLVDPPNPSYITPYSVIKRVLRYLPYAITRAERIGLRRSALYLREHITKFFARAFGTKQDTTETKVAQRMIEAAAVGYKPARYDGKVLLLLAADRPPHVNLLPGWQEVVPNLHTEYVASHHRDLLKAENARSVADAIVLHLGSAATEKSADASLGVAPASRSTAHWATAI